MKNIYTEFQANFIKHAEDAKKLLHGEFTTENGDYKVFTEDGITAYIIPKAMWWINDDRIAEKFGDPQQMVRRIREVQSGYREIHPEDRHNHDRQRRTRSHGIL